MSTLSRDPILKRFISKVDIRGDDECWEWKAGIVKGYGSFTLNGKEERAHRIAYFIRHGSLPCFNDAGERIIVCHTCDNPSCCNPAHLFLGTYADNMQDAVNKKRMATGESHGRSKLTTDQAQKIKLMLIKKIPQRSIARCFNIAQSTVHNIKINKTWK